MGREGEAQIRLMRERHEELALAGGHPEDFDTVSRRVLAKRGQLSEAFAIGRGRELAPVLEVLAVEDREHLAGLGTTQHVVLLRARRTR